MKTTASNLVYNPADVAKLGYDYIEYKRDHKEFAVEFPVKKMRNRVYPLAAGEVMTLIARPGNMKTGLMMLWARQRAQVIRPYEGRVVVYATWEQSIEELHSFYIAAEQQISVTRMAKGELSEEEMNKVLTASGTRMKEPLFFVGHSVMRKSGRQPITVTRLGDAIDSIQNDGFVIDSLYVDYLQRIQPENPAESQVTAYSKTMDALKNTALGFGVPMVVGVQASREVEALDMPIPEMHHAQWTSNIEQSSDRVMSLVRPRRYRAEGQIFGITKVVGQSQLLIRTLKQKLGEANFDEWVNVNPLYNKLDDDEMEVR
jgi:replicative DNA helicase